MTMMSMVNATDTHVAGSTQGGTAPRGIGDDSLILWSFADGTIRREATRNGARQTGLEIESRPAPPSHIWPAWESKR
jgi:hypothetical protein